ncbi:MULTISPECIES: molybdopterin-dependent oxidoreductase [unclassified Rathayibacter]|uniref:molybdopterin-dependent oxidoreductase n=1 Tax=unclassified Rathayibacter TaxID=2609250 RepID=UPI00104D4968|nr:MULTISPECIES: molybdopterin-dependent oxidoreductase [unclassified Rathayibacter]MCJ1702600.1 molybdopterin-dependent oxidoreductase [Rathayibacter sp. VKM Ac-2926]TCL85783.1 DMSO/TMAO reductase YedYZ molybdopterin-dependent catalytic subunit [Rathayibacter sp. PhB192]TCM31604.1 DMSO/TMAO reductase YedYZ molybdopterin-dependent catalytic subunit [Rathayibacter sp. PhB179]
MEQTGKNPRVPKLRFIALSAVAGIVVAGVLLAIAELVALVVAKNASPVLALGAFVVDIVPRPLKEFAIETFGANDKIFLLASIGVAVLVAAALAGVLQLIRPPLGQILLVIAGGLSIAAIVTRTGATPLSAVPTLVGLVVAMIVMHLTVSRLRRWRAASAAEKTGAAPAARPVGIERRGFFRVTLIAAVGAAVIGAGARAVNAATSSLASVRDALRLPSPRSTVSVPAGADLGIDGLTPLYTPNADFYRVDTALTVPSIDPSTWSLKISGMVDQEITMSLQDIFDMGLDEYGITMTCVSYQVGGDLVGNAKWLGVPLRDVLKKAGVQSGADMLLSTSVDGYTASTPLSAVTDENLDAILAVGMNGEALPFEHGFPVRMVIPGLYGYVSATKWLTELKVTTFAADEAYWTPRGYDAEAPIKMSSRIDTPRIDAAIPAGATKIAGVAWAQTTGIAKVEVSIDDGDWQEATLSTPVNLDTWVQWYIDWDAASGAHYVAVRATDANGMLQIEDRAGVAPNGSSGWQRTLVRVS